MRISNRHERVISATPERVAGLVSDFEAIWPTQIVPPPRPLRDRRYREGPMVWEEFERAGAIRAFRVILPDELRGEHWFEAHPVDGGTLVRHSIVGDAVGEYEAIWRDRIEPSHDRILEAIFDNIEAAVRVEQAAPLVAPAYDGGASEDEVAAKREAHAETLAKGRHTGR